jgi:transketolase
MITDIKKMKETASSIRCDIVNMISEANSGHPGGALSATDLMVTLYFGHLRHDPKNPLWPDRDRVIFSKGHCSTLLYSCLARAGYFPLEELSTYRKLGSRLQGHPSRMKGPPGVEVSTGSLGQGLSIGVGMALGFKLDKKNTRIYVLMGDGECDCGQIWEAAMSAGHYKLDNLCGIVDRNELQIDGSTEEVMNLMPFKEKWRDFGWYVIDVDGHNIREVYNAYEEAERAKGAPTVIVARTLKGRGVSFMECKAEWHGKAPTKEQTEQALKELKTK